MPIDKKFIKTDEFILLSNSKKCLCVAYALGHRVDEFGDYCNINGKGYSVNICARGYYYFSFRLPSSMGFERGSPSHVHLHSLQAFQIYGKAYLNGSMVARHLNNNKLDNSAPNISIGTNKENYHDNKVNLIEVNQAQYVEMAAQKKRGKNLNLWSDVYIDRDKGMSYSELSSKYKIPKSSLSFHFGNGKSKVDDEYKSIILENINNR